MKAIARIDSDIYHFLRKHDGISVYQMLETLKHLSMGTLLHSLEALVSVGTVIVEDGKYYAKENL